MPTISDRIYRIWMLVCVILSILFIPSIMSAALSDFRYTACVPIHSLSQDQISVNQRLKKMMKMRVFCDAGGGFGDW